MSDLPVPKKHPTSNWSAIWILPLLALVIGAWLAWRAYDEAGPIIQVRFESGDGIQAKKTEVLYKGISVGKVVELNVSDDIKGVLASIEMTKETEKYLNEDTHFWLVKPRVSLAGVTGLETLVSGVYIAVDPAKGDKGDQGVRSFTALKEPPPMSEKVPGLHITLKAERLGSLEQGSPVFYKQILVGQVKSFQLGEDQRTIEIRVHIEPTYADLVRKHTRFWNASGISISGGLSGFKVRSESLLTLAAGGISFATPDNHRDSPPTDTSKPFRLYEDYDAAQVGLRVTLKMKDLSDIQPGQTQVMYNGVQVGLVKNVDMNQDFSGATAELAMDPRVEALLLEGTEFWTVKPNISLAGITGLDALVKGNYIAVRFAKSGVPRREFSVLSKAPPMDMNVPGLHLILTSDRRGSVEVGAPVLYRQIRVGSVQSYQLSADNQRVMIGVHIEPEFTRLVNSSTRFWNASGVTLSGDLTGLKVKSESLQTLINGGISFDTPDPKAPTSGKERRFALYDSEEAAMARGVEIQLSVEDAEGLREGTPIRFKGLLIGKVERIDLKADLSGALLKARLGANGEPFARSGTRFWVVRPALGLLRTENLGTLVSGSYIEALPSSRPGERQTRFQTLAEAPNLLAGGNGLRLTLSAPDKGSIKLGSPVTYRKMPVGKVIDMSLGPQADRVLVSILIEPRYVPLVRTGSRFWNASGVGIEAGLFKGVSVRTESLEAMVAGGIAFATPDNGQMGEPAKQGQTFALFDAVDEQWLEWAPKISLKDAGQ
ncbi:PqiB family protein [Pseudomonas sp. NFIX28]|uniref:PqiB family protein n=1 Tax=Pseudomonas sp. NFIX28 TaxID=1566235 RepID=UPI00089A0FA4|nr:MlaD family protein [Pseudomonas sp. NFIX28]SDY42965.1 Paraquat-inducible protein B [Pseudomonas sp. NFIX28]